MIFLLESKLLPWQELASRNLNCEGRQLSFSDCKSGLLLAGLDYRPLGRCFLPSMLEDKKQIFFKGDSLAFTMGKRIVRVESLFAVRGF